MIVSTRNTALGVWKGVAVGDEQEREKAQKDTSMQKRRGMADDESGSGPGRQGEAAPQHHRHGPVGTVRADVSTGHGIGKA
eukprot:786171-Rhodomonas_salina.2